MSVDVKKEVASEGDEEEKEETEATKMKWTEATRRKRQMEKQRREMIRRIIAGEDVEGVGEEKRRRIIEAEERDRLRKRRWREENLEKQRRRDMERKRRRRELMTEEERRAKRERENFQRMMRKLGMTEEEREEMKRKQYFSNQAQRAKRTREEREELRRKHSEYGKRRWEGLSEEEKRREVEKNKEWRNKLDGEKKRRYYEGAKIRIQRWKEKLKENDPEEWRRRQDKMRENKRERRRRLGDEANNAKEKERWEKKDAEEKRRRLNQMKMYRQKRKLRDELEGMGVVKEEIERRVEELDKRLREQLGIGPPRLKRGPGNQIREGAVHSLAYQNEINLEEDGGGDDDTFCDINDGTEVPSPEAMSPPSPLPPEEEETPRPVSPFVGVTFPCKFCKVPPFSTEEDLKTHLTADHLKNCWKCPKCSEVMISSKQLSEHFKAKHKKVLVTPQSQNNILFEKKMDLGNKERSIFVEYLCMRCPCPWQPENKCSKIIKVFKSWRELQSHVKKKHRKYYWPCQHCHLLKYSSESLNVHLMWCRRKPR